MFGESALQASPRAHILVNRLWRIRVRNTLRLMRANFGLGLVLSGAAIMVLGMFLPLNEPTGPFAQIQQNTLAQSGGLILFVLAVGIVAGGIWAFLKPSLWTWLAPLISSLIFGAWIALIAFNEDTRTLYPVIDGVPDTSEPGVVATLGIAIYVAGAGVAFAVVGSVLLAIEAIEGPHEEPDRLLAEWEKPQRRKCPDCAEMILADAKVCKHCGYRFATTRIKCFKCDHREEVLVDRTKWACEQCGQKLKRRS